VIEAVDAHDVRNKQPVIAARNPCI
jgi:hypothetical protein